MLMEKEMILQRSSVAVIGEFIKDCRATEFFIDIETTFEEAGKQSIREIKELLLRNNLPTAETERCMELIDKYTKSRENILFIYGMRSGGKLLHELSGHV